MKAVIFNTEQEAINCNNTLTEAAKPLFDENTTSYSYVLKHPDKELFCVPIDVAGKYYEAVKELVNKATKLSVDWFKEIDLSIIKREEL